MKLITASAHTHRSKLSKPKGQIGNIHVLKKEHCHCLC